MTAAASAACWRRASALVRRFSPQRMYVSERVLVLLPNTSSAAGYQPSTAARTSAARRLFLELHELVGPAGLRHFATVCGITRAQAPRPHRAG